MVFLFVYGALTRSGDLNSVMNRVTFIAGASVKGKLILQGDTYFLSAGQETIVGEIYQISKIDWDSLVYDVRKAYQPLEMDIISIKAKARESSVDCFCFTLKELSSS